MKHAAIVASTLLLLAALGACAQEASVVGSWELSEISADGESYSGAALEEIGRSGETLELTESGEVTWDTSDALETGTYTYDAEAGTLNFDVVNQDDQSAQYNMVVDELTSDMMTISIPDFLTFTFTRQ